MHIGNEGFARDAVAVLERVWVEEDVAGDTATLDAADRANMDRGRATARDRCRREVGDSGA